MSNRPREPALALAMSLLLPGYGQLYNGEANKAIWVFLAFALLSAPAAALVALHLPSAPTVPALALGSGRHPGNRALRHGGRPARRPGPPRIRCRPLADQRALRSGAHPL